MLRISKGKETFALKGDHLETNFQGFYQKSLHWRPRSPMETSVHNPGLNPGELKNQIIIKFFNWIKYEINQCDIIKKNN